MRLDTCDVDQQHRTPSQQRQNQLQSRNRLLLARSLRYRLAIIGQEVRAPSASLILGVYHAEELLEDTFRGLRLFVRRDIHIRAHTLTHTHVRTHLQNTRRHSSPFESSRKPSGLKRDRSESAHLTSMCAFHLAFALRAPNQTPLSTCSTLVASSVCYWHRVQTRSTFLHGEHQLRLEELRIFPMRRAREARTQVCELRVEKGEVQSLPKPKLYLFRHSRAEKSLQVKSCGREMKCIAS